MKRTFADFGLQVRVALVVLWLFLLTPSAVWSQAARSEVEGGFVASRDADGAMFLEAIPRRGEGWLGFAERLCGSVDRAAELRAANSRNRMLSGRRYRVPYSCLRPDLKGQLLRHFNGNDRPTSAGWLHVVGRAETLWEVAERFTGDGTNFRLIRAQNALGDEELVTGQEVVVPTAILIEPFRSTVQVAGLMQASALYSSVVVRFTGRLFASDVNPLAEEIARRSGIADVTEIPVGYEVKIPFDLLQPEFLPPGHPRRVEYEDSLTRSAQFSNSIRSRDLAGITVVLDAGHGGQDVGATQGGVWESLYVYDIMLRVRSELERRTAARVVPTTRDGRDFVIEAADVLTYSKEHQVLTSPPYPITDSKVGVGLRWYLANSVMNRRDPEQTVFVSIHADSLHPSVRGAMVYVPGLLPIPTSYGLSAAVYTKRAEVRERPTVSFTKTERVKSEGLSRDLADQIIRGFRVKELAVHPNKPVRDRIVRRRGRPWVPAVLRYNAVPAKVLVEVCNLANDEDRRLIQTQAYRQIVAEAVVQGILDYYSEASGTAEAAR